MKLERRPYETRAVSNIRKALIEHRRVVAVGPTGCGKTVVAAMLIKQEPAWRVLFVAHRYEIIDQAYAQLAKQGVTAGVIMASDERLHGCDRVDPIARVQVASVQTVARRGGPEHVDLIVFDEAHRVMADSYQAIAAAYPDAMILGLTATPIRLDGRGLGDFFAHMVTIAKPSELYAEGYLARPRVFAAPAHVLVEMRKRTAAEPRSRGEYTDAQLGRIVNSGMLVGKVVSESMRLAPKVPKVVFAGSVKHSKALAVKFKRCGVSAAHLDGETPVDERVRILDALRSGDVEVVCNVGVLNEGWDLPELGGVILARPTRSKSWLLQATGRVQRPYKNRVPLILDHGNSCIDLDTLPGADEDWSLDRDTSKRAGDAVVKVCADCLEIIPGGCTECPSCGADQPKTARQEREEIEAKLVELDAKKFAAIRARVEKVAKDKGAPSGWVEKIMQSNLAQ